MPRTLADDIEADVSRVFLDTRHFAVSVTRYANGIGSGVSVTAIWTPDKSSKDTSLGESNISSGVLHVSASQDLDARDLWLIDGEKWFTEHWHTLPGGMKEATLTKGDKKRQSAPGSSGKY